MRQATIDPPYHQSTLNAYLSCPEALRLTAIVGAKPAFRHYARVRGTAVHATIHRLHAESAWERAGAIFQEEWGLQLSLPGPRINADAKKLDKEFDDWAAAVEQYAVRECAAPVLYCELHVRGTVRSRGGRSYAVEGTVDRTASTRQFAYR